MKLFRYSKILVVVLFLAGCAAPSQMMVNPNTGHKIDCSTWGIGWLGTPVALAAYVSCVSKSKKLGYVPIEKAGTITQTYSKAPVDNSSQYYEEAITDIINSQRASQLGIVNVKYDSYDLRSKPMFRGQVVDEISEATDLKVVSESGNWLKVETPQGQKGWVAKSWIKDSDLSKDNLAEGYQMPITVPNLATVDQYNDMEKQPIIVSPEPQQIPLSRDSANVVWRAAKNVRLLSVGVGDFKDSKLPQVKHARSDAQNIESFLKSSGVPEENITCLTNEHASRSDITDALVRLKMATTEPYETAIFYFSGHGAPIIKSGKIVDAALIPYDAMESSLEYTGLRISMLKEMLSDMRGNSIVILDTCFSGKEGRSLMTKNVKAIAVVPKDFNVIQGSGKKSWWLTATSGDNFANDFQKGNSGLFTYYFLKALNGEEGVDANEDGLISMREAFNWTKKEVQAVSAKSLGRLQVPELIAKGDTILTIPK